jgi:DNA-binding IclR family transcriptional regulator
MTRKSENPNHTPMAVKSAERVMDVLILLARNPNGLQLRDIAQQLHIPSSSMYAILSTMKQRGFVEREKGSLLYCLGNKFYEILPRSVPEYVQDDMVSVALPIMEKIQRATQETVTLSVLIKKEIVFIGKRSGSAFVQVVNALGSRLPAHATASGKVIMSYLSEEDVDRIFSDENLPKITDNTITSKIDFKQQLAIIRKLGYACDNEESIVGVWAVAGCIHSQDGQPIAATSIVIPTYRVTEALKERCKDLIKYGAEEITSKLYAGTNRTI